MDFTVLFFSLFSRQKLEANYRPADYKHCIYPIFVKTLIVTEPQSILFVDDDADDTFLFREVVAEVDPALLFTSANNGEEALQKLTAPEAPLPHLIFMDLNMPRMGGKECLSAIKEHEKLKGIPVIMYTTSSYAKDREELMRLGATYYITKPSNYNELKETLTIVIRNLADLPKAFDILNRSLV